MKNTGSTAHLSNSKISLCLLILLIAYCLLVSGYNLGKQTFNLSGCNRWRHQIKQTAKEIEGYSKEETRCVYTKRLRFLYGKNCILWYTILGRMRQSNTQPHSTNESNIPWPPVVFPSSARYRSMSKACLIHFHNQWHARVASVIATLALMGCPANLSVLDVPLCWNWSFPSIFLPYFAFRISFFSSLFHKLSGY